MSNITLLKGNIIFAESHFLLNENVYFPEDSGLVKIFEQYTSDKRRL